MLCPSVINGEMTMLHQGKIDGFCAIKGSMIEIQKQKFNVFEKCILFQNISIDKAVVLYNF